MSNLDLTTEQLKDILDDTHAVRRRFIKKAEELAEAGKFEEARTYCKAVSDLSKQFVRIYDQYIESQNAA